MEYEVVGDFDVAAVAGGLDALVRTEQRADDERCRSTYVVEGSEFHVGLCKGVASESVNASIADLETERGSQSEGQVEQSCPYERAQRSPWGWVVNKRVGAAVAVDDEERGCGRGGG